LDITQAIVTQAITQAAVLATSSEISSTAPALQITIVAAIILLTAPVEVPAVLEVQVRQEAVAEGLRL